MYKVFIGNKPLIFCSEAESASLPTAFKRLSRKDLNSLQQTLDKLASSKVPGAWVRLGEERKNWKLFSNEIRHIPAAGGAVRREDGKLLFIYRRKHWDLPKGKLEKGESIAEGAVREVQEECGLNDVRIIAPLETTYHCFRKGGEWCLKPSHWYLMEQHCNLEPIPQEEEDITEVRWLSKEEYDAARPTFPSIELVAAEAFQRPM